jgi:hypothetical protein
MVWYLRRTPCGGLKAEAKYRLCFDRICFIGFIGLYVMTREAYIQ